MNRESLAAARQQQLRFAAEMEADFRGTHSPIDRSPVLLMPTTPSPGPISARHHGRRSVQRPLELRPGCRR